MIPRYLANPTVTELALTSEQKDWPRYNKAAAVVSMDPALFLGLTTVGTEHEAEVAAEAHTLEDYNRYGSIVHPFLVVDRKTGEVMSHEGRHRAAAVQVAGGGDFPVAVILYPAPQGRYVGGRAGGVGIRVFPKVRPQAAVRSS